MTDWREVTGFLGLIAAGVACIYGVPLAVWALAKMMGIQ